MTKTYQIKINQGKDSTALDVPQAGPKGQAVTVKASAGARYQLIDPATGYGPENIRASRQGKDLKVSFEGSKTTDLVIEDYYKVSADNFNGLIGEAESGKFYEYIPENAAGMASVPMLADSGQVVGMALGGAEVAPAGAAVGVLAAGLFSPWLLGAGALGLAAAGGGGGSGGAAATTDTTKPSGQTGELAVVSDSGARDHVTNVTKPTITGKAEAVSTVEVSFGDPAGKVTGPYKTTADANGNYSVRVPVDLVDLSVNTKGTQYTPVIKATDAAGNSSTVDGTPFVVDTQAPALVLTIDADANNNGVINVSENGGSTKTSDLKVTATFDKAQAGVGDVVHFQLNGGQEQTVTLTQAMVDAGKAVWTFVGGIVDQAVLKVNSWFVDTLNNQSATATDTATVDMRVPNGGLAVGLKVMLDSNGDGIIKSTEQNAAQSTDLTATFDFKKAVAGDKVIFSDGINSKEVILTAADVAQGSVTTTGWGLPTQGKPTTFSAVLSNPAGNTTPLVEKIVSIDPASAPSTKTALILDAITSDNLINLAEQANGDTEITGTVSGAFKENDDVVTLTLNGKFYTAQASATGKFSVKVSTADLIADSDTRIDAKVTGTNGELATAMQDYQVETSQNAGKLTALSIDAITSDNLINLNESKVASIALTGTVTGKFQAGDTVTLLVNGVKHTGTIDETGKYSVSVETTLLLADADTTVDAFVTGTGGTSAIAMQNYGIDKQAPLLKSLTIDLDTSNKDGRTQGGDGWINKNEKGVSEVTSLTAVFDNTTVSVGDKITFSDGTITKFVILDESMVKAGSASSTDWNLPSENGKLNVTAVLTDAAGNTSNKASDFAMIDATAATVSPSLNATDFKLNTFGFASNETGTYKLHVGNLEFTELTLPAGGKSLVSTDTRLEAKDIFFEHWDVAGNLSTTYLVDSVATTPYTVTSNTTFVV